MPIMCPNESGFCATEDCENTKSSIWYGKKGSKTCKHCYDTITKKKKQKLTAAQQEVEHALAGDTLVDGSSRSTANGARTRLEPATSG